MTAVTIIRKYLYRTLPKKYIKQLKLTVPTHLNPISNTYIHLCKTRLNCDRICFDSFGKRPPPTRDQNIALYRLKPYLQTYVCICSYRPYIHICVVTTLRTNTSWITTVPSGRQTYTNNVWGRGQEFVLVFNKKKCQNDCCEWNSNS